jgi:hypothetical protein
MKRNHKIQIATLSLVLAGIVGFISGCKDVFEEDISKRELIINSPVQGAQSTIYNQLFWWNKMEGATQYSIQVVTPSFDSLVKVLADTTVVGTDKFYKTLEPGKYQWRIRAENGYYKTEYQTYSFTMLVSPIEDQIVALKSPANNTFVGKPSNGAINFAWEKLYGATKYLLQIDTVPGDFTSGLLLDTVVTDFSVYYVLEEGDYNWRVKAQDDDGNETPWSSVYTTGYYGTDPSIPVLNSSPPADTTVDDALTSIKLSWGKVNTAKTYRLSIYLNAAQADTAEESSVVHTIDAPTLHKILNLSSYAPGDVIYWRVSATDKAGNKGDMCKPRTIKIQ